MSGFRNTQGHPRWSAVVMGGSAGGIVAARRILEALPPSFPLPVVVVLHQSPDARQFWQQALHDHCPLQVVEAADKMTMEPATVYCAPANYHLLLEREGTFSLSIDDKVNFARPSIDILFSSAAEAFAEGIIGVILTGANSDGARGLADVASRGGTAIVQSPATAQWPQMPRFAQALTPEALVLDLDAIAPTIVGLVAADSKRNSTA